MLDCLLPDCSLLAIQADALHTLNPKTDSTLLLAREAQRRGMKTFLYTPNQLALTCAETVDVSAVGVFFILDDNLVVQDCSAPVSLSLNQAKYVMIRQDPPYDLSYITALDILNMLPPSVRMLTLPDTLLLLKEKIIPLYFPELSAKSCVTSDKTTLLSFLDTYQKIVVKPLHSFGGTDVFLLTQHDTNNDCVIDIMLSKYPFGIIAHEFVENVTTNERRLIFIDGELKAVFKRIPKDGSIRSNTGAGGTPTACAVTEMDHFIASHIGPYLKKNGVILAGVDAIDDKLIEVNITSPTGLLYANRLYGTHLEQDYWDAVIKNDGA